MKTTGSVQTYPFLFENGYIRFVPVWRTVHRYPMKTVTENASFQKLSPERRSLKTPFCSTCVDTEVFENDYITVLDISMRMLPSKMVLMVQSLLLWVLHYFPCGQAKTIKKNTTRGRPFLTCFFFKRRKKISTLRQKRKRVDGPLIPLRNCYKDCKEITIVIANDLGSRGQKV